jgi:hypothetical protein
MTMSNPRKKTTTKKATPKKTPRMSASAARAEGAAKTKRALADAKAVTEANLKAIAAADQENAAKRDERATSADAMTASERAMAKTKASPARTKKPAAKAAKPKRETATKRVSGLDLAAKVLASVKEPLNAKTIAERAIAAGWKTSGKTPHATLYAAMIREIAAKGKDARFRKTDRGLFAAAGKGA